MDIPLDTLMPNTGLFLIGFAQTIISAAVSLFVARCFTARDRLSDLPACAVATGWFLHASAYSGPVDAAALAHICTMFGGLAALAVAWSLYRRRWASRGDEQYL